MEEGGIKYDKKALLKSCLVNRSGKCHTFTPFEIIDLWLLVFPENFLFYFGTSVTFVSRISFKAVYVCPLNIFVKTSPKIPPIVWGIIHKSTKQSKNKKT